MTSRFLLVEVRVGRKDEIPSIADWASYKKVRDMIGMTEDQAYRNNPAAGNAEVGQVIEITDNGLKTRFGYIFQEEMPWQKHKKS